MREGFYISAFIHVVVVAIAMTGLPFLETAREVMPEVIPVEFIDIAELSSAPEREKPARSEPEPEVPKPKPKPQRQIEPPRAIENSVPLPDNIAKPRAKPAPPKKRQTASLAPRAKPRPPKRFDSGRISALLDKRQETRQAEIQDRKQPDKNATSDLKIKSRFAALDQQRLTASLSDAMRAQIERCWIIPAGARDARDLTITIRVSLNPDGSLARPPEIVDAKRMFQKGQEFYRVAAEGARRAVQKCAPLDLPVEHYEIWRVSELTFDPSKMLGG